MENPENTNAYNDYLEYFKRFWGAQEGFEIPGTHTEEEQEKIQNKIKKLYRIYKGSSERLTDEEKTY